MQNLISLAIICPGVIGITTKYYIASQVYLHQSITCLVDKGLFTSFSSICVNDTQADDIENSFFRKGLIQTNAVYLLCLQSHSVALKVTYCASVGTICKMYLMYMYD